MSEKKILRTDGLYECPCEYPDIHINFDMNSCSIQCHSCWKGLGVTLKDILLQIAKDKWNSGEAKWVDGVYKP